MQLKTFQYRLYPTAAQERCMQQVLTACRHWYNMALAEKKYAWELERRNVSKSDLEKMGIRYRETFPKAQAVFSQTMQTVCDDVDKAFQAFFRRCKAGETPGYPRFKGANHFHSFGFKQYGAGLKVDGRRLRLFGIGRVAVRWHRPIEGQIKTARIVDKAGRWFVCFACELPDAVPLPETGHVAGIDMGINALITTSDGDKVENPRWYRAAQHDLRLAQHGLQRKQKGGKNRGKALLQVQRLHAHIKNQRQDCLNKVVHALVIQNDLIALENLVIRNMVRNSRLAKSILDAGWGFFKERLMSKAVNAGREVIFVNPAYTSKTCAACGAAFEHFTLSTRWVTCVCGLSLDRDHNAAINVLKRTGQDVSVQLNVGALRPCVL